MLIELNLLEERFKLWNWSQGLRMAYQCLDTAIRTIHFVRVVRDKRDVTVSAVVINLHWLTVIQLPKIVVMDGGSGCWMVTRDLLGNLHWSWWGGSVERRFLIYAFNICTASSSSPWDFHSRHQISWPDSCYQKATRKNSPLAFLRVSRH